MAKKLSKEKEVTIDSELEVYVEGDELSKEDLLKLALLLSNQNKQDNSNKG